MLSGDDPQYQKQKKCVKEDGSSRTPARDSSELDAVRSQRVRFVIPVLVVESFVLGPSAHQWWKHGWSVRSLDCEAMISNFCLFLGAAGSCPCVTEQQQEHLAEKKTFDMPGYSVLPLRSRFRICWQQSVAVQAQYSKYSRQRESSTMSNLLPLEFRKSIGP